MRADDAATFKEDSLWGSAGPCLRIVETKNIYDLLSSYADGPGCCTLALAPAQFSFGWCEGPA